MSSDFKQNNNPETVPRLHPLKHHQSVRVEETVVRASAYGEFERDAYERHLERLAMLGLCHCSASVRSGRLYQEDRTSTYEHPSLPIKAWAVYDGHGGAYVSDYLSKDDRFLRELVDEVFARPQLATSDRIEHFFLQFDRKNFADNPSARTCGSTACVAVLCDDILYLASTGDSCAICFDQNGRLLMQTTEHKPEHPFEAARLQSLGHEVDRGSGAPSTSVWRVNGRLAMSRAFGDYYLKPGVTARPSVSAIRFAAPSSHSDDNERRAKTPASGEKRYNYYLLLATDGVWDCYTAQQLIGVVRKQLQTFGSAQKVAKSMQSVCGTILNAVESACKNRVSDNKTLMLIHVARTEYATLA